MHRDTHLCCASVPGSKGDDVSKILNACDEFNSSQPVGAYESSRLPYTKRAMKAHIRKTAFPFVSWIAWLTLRILISQVINWWLWRNKKCQPEELESLSFTDSETETTPSPTPSPLTNTESEFSLIQTPED